MVPARNRLGRHEAPGFQTFWLKYSLRIFLLNQLQPGEEGLLALEQKNIKFDHHCERGLSQKQKVANSCCSLRHLV